MNTIVCLFSIQIRLQKTQIKIKMSSIIGVLQLAIANSASLALPMYLRAAVAAAYKF